MTRSPRKPPKPFGKPLAEKKFRKRLANRIYLEPDRAFLAGITTTDDDGKIVLARELSKEERGRLKKLRKAAKKNRRGPRTVRLTILALLVGVVVVFTVVFKDQLVTRSAEQFLENVFGARVDVGGLRFRPLRGEITFSSLTIADAEAPMENLVELADGAFEVDSWQLVNGHVLINQLAVAGLQFGTPRDQSGALEPGPPEDSAREDTEAGDVSSSESVGSAGRLTDAVPAISFADLGLPSTLDARQFLEENLDALATPRAVEALAAGAESFVDRWRAQLGALTDDLTSVADDVVAFGATDFTAIRSVEAAMAVYDEAAELEATVTGVSASIEAQYNALVAEATGILDAARGIPAGARTDYENLVARIPEVKAEGRKFITGIVEQYLRAALGDWYDRADRALSIYRRFTAGDRETEPHRAGRTGTDIDFSTTVYPRLLLSDAELGVGTEDDETLAVRIRNLTSDPNLLDEPARIDYRQAGSRGRLTVAASLDGRTNAAEPLTLSVRTEETPLAISRGLESLGIGSVTGALGFAADLSRDTFGVVGGGLELRTTSVRAVGDYEPDSIGEFLADLLNSADALTGSFGFVARSRDDVEFTEGETNLDDLVAGAIRERIDAALAAFREELDARVTGYLDPIIAALSDRLDGIVEVETSAEELLDLAHDREAAAAELQRVAQDSINSLRDRLESEARAALDAAKAEAEAAARKAAEEAEAQARAAAEAAAAQAEAAARDAAESAAESATDAVRNALPFGRRR